MRNFRGCPVEETSVSSCGNYGSLFKYSNFHWWNPTDNRKKAIKDEIPIPVMPDRYPYRYTSAGPCTVGRTQKQWDIHRCFVNSKPKIKRQDRFDLREIVQIEGYETTSMTASLVPFCSKETITEFKSTKIPHNLTEPLFVPYKGHSEFDQYVIDTLYPNWKSDPLYKRRLIFRMDFFKQNKNN